MTEIKKAKIYTKSGDQGSTRLVDGQKVLKSNLRVEAYGCVDELNSQLGFCRSLIQESLTAHPHLMKIDQKIFRIQNHLFNLGSLLACEDREMKSHLRSLDLSHVQFLEMSIDKLSTDLPELKNFILPGGHLISSSLHVARTICRRSERKVVRLFKDPGQDPEIHQNTDEVFFELIYLNRLSDFLFVAARWVQNQFQLTDIAWDNQA